MGRWSEDEVWGHCENVEKLISFKGKNSLEKMWWMKWWFKRKEYHMPEKISVQILCLLLLVRWEIWLFWRLKHQWFSPMDSQRRVAKLLIAAMLVVKKGLIIHIIVEGKWTWSIRRLPTFSWRNRWRLNLLRNLSLIVGFFILRLGIIFLLGLLIFLRRDLLGSSQHVKDLFGYIFFFLFFGTSPFCNEWVIPIFNHMLCSCSVE